MKSVTGMEKKNKTSGVFQLFYPCFFGSELAPIISKGLSKSTTSTEIGAKPQPLFSNIERNEYKTSKCCKKYPTQYHSGVFGFCP
jgi:hypothetical protein